jgi:hypothetical protein
MNLICFDQAGKRSKNDECNGELGREELGDLLRKKVLMVMKRKIHTNVFINA